MKFAVLHYYFKTHVVDKIIFVFTIYVFILKHVVYARRIC